MHLLPHAGRLLENRVRDARDERTQVVSLTARGREAQAGVRAAWARVEAEILSALPASKTEDAHGGAVFSVSRASQLEATEIQFTSCVFEGNRAGGDGGGACIHDSSQATFSACAFRANEAGRDGGGMAVTGGSSAAQDNCTFADNYAAGSGADIHEEPRGRRGPGRMGAAATEDAPKGLIVTTEGRSVFF